MSRYEPIILFPYSTRFDTLRDRCVFQVEGTCTPAQYSEMNKGLREHRLCLVSTVEVDKIKAKLAELAKQRDDLLEVLQQLPACLR